MWGLLPVTNLVSTPAIHPTLDGWPWHNRPMTESAATRTGPSQSRRFGAFEWFHDRGLGNERFGTVLILILIGFLVSGFDSTLITQMLTGAINAIVLILVFRETGMAQSGSRLATIIAIGSLSFALMSVFDRDQPSGGVVWLLQAALALVVSVAITARILRHRRVGLQTVFGAVCVRVDRPHVRFRLRCTPVDPGPGGAAG
jgi:hypothetical protein